MKKILMVMLALVIAIVPLSGCKPNGDEVSMISVWVDEDGNTITNDNDEGNEAGNAGGTTSKKGTTTSSKKGITTTSSKKTTSQEPTKPKADGTYDFGGKTYTMAITQEEQYNTTSFKQMKTAFEK